MPFPVPEEKKSVAKHRLAEGKHGGVLLDRDARDQELYDEACYLDFLLDIWDDLHSNRTSRESSYSPIGDWGEEPIAPPARLLALAQWAFAHLPSLKIIAYGDFSHSGCYAKYTKLLCRNELTTWQADRANGRSIITSPSDLTFRDLREDDTDLQILLNASRGMLSACPVDRYLMTCLDKY